MFVRRRDIDSWFGFFCFSSSDIVIPFAVRIVIRVWYDFSIIRIFHHRDFVIETKWSGGVDRRTFCWENCRNNFSRFYGRGRSRRWQMIRTVLREVWIRIRNVGFDRHFLVRKATRGDRIMTAIWKLGVVYVLLLPCIVISVYQPQILHTKTGKNWFESIVSVGTSAIFQSKFSTLFWEFQEMDEEWRECVE